ncbi:hypothetical protein [Enterococcus sp. DIV0800]|uniref:hypothetical protein n=1 Tax=unclassified Enterococcus TaxID=2608891 RepID=UPI003D300D6A
MNEPIYFESVDELREHHRELRSGITSGVVFEPREVEQVATESDESVEQAAPKPLDVVDPDELIEQAAEKKAKKAAKAKAKKEAAQDD